MSGINRTILDSAETLLPNHVINLETQFLLPSLFQRVGGIVHLFREYPDKKKSSILNPAGHARNCKSYLCQGEIQS